VGNLDRQILRQPFNRVEQLGNASGEGGHLRLLQPDADQRPALASLQVEAPRTGFTGGTSHESLGSIEIEDTTRHGPIVSGIAPVQLRGP